MLNIVVGEANPEDLEPFVFNKQTRQLVKITMDNWEDAQDMLTSSRAKRQIMIQKGIINENLIGLNE